MACMLLVRIPYSLISCQRDLRGCQSRRGTSEVQSLSLSLRRSGIYVSLVYSRPGCSQQITDGSKNTSEFDSTRPRFFFIIIHALEWISRNPLRLYDIVTYTILPTESIFISLILSPTASLYLLHRNFTSNIRYVYSGDPRCQCHSYGRVLRPQIRSEPRQLGQCSL